MKMIQDPELAEKYPMVAVMQNKSQEAKGENSRFLQMLRGCGFEKMIALMSEKSNISYVTHLISYFQASLLVDWVVVKILRSQKSTNLRYPALEAITTMTTTKTTMTKRSN